MHANMQHHDHHEHHDHHHLPHRHHPQQTSATTQDEKTPLTQSESTLSLSDLSATPSLVSTLNTIDEKPHASGDSTPPNPAPAASSGSYLDQPFSILWRKSLVSLPRLVPDSVLKYTSPEGPHPIVLKISSHGKHHIPVYVFVPNATQPKQNPSAATTAAASVVEGVQAVAAAGAEGAPAISQTKAELKKASAEQKAEAKKMTPEEKAEAKKLAADQKAEAKKASAEEKAEARKLSADQKAEAKKASAEQKAEAKKALAEQKAEAKTARQAKYSDTEGRSSGDELSSRQRRQALTPTTTPTVEQKKRTRLQRATTGTKHETVVKLNTNVSAPTTDSEPEGAPTSSKHKAAGKEVLYKAGSTRRKLPVLIDFHGGSFILGSCQEQAPFCAQMARELDCIVISVDYRLGPYDKYPAANEDADDVLKAILDPEKPGYRDLREGLDMHMRKHAKPLVGIDRERIAISGFSSGGNLALGLMLSVKNDPTINSDWPSPIPTTYAHDIPVLLFYPSLDCRMLPAERPRPPGLDPESEMMKAMALETKLMPTYLPVEKRGHPRASPGLVDIQGEDSGLHSQARMFLILPQLDSLSEQSNVWVDKVKKEGRGQHLLVEKVDKVAHGWTQFPDSWLTKHDRERKIHVFAMARDFVEKTWSSRTFAGGLSTLREERIIEQDPLA